MNKNNRPKYVYLDKFNRQKDICRAPARLNYLERWNRYLKIAIIAILCGQIMPVVLDWLIF